jgi:hypothetical protein
MRILQTVFALEVVLSFSIACSAQANAGPAPGAPAAPAAPPAAPLPSALLQSSLDMVQKAVAATKLDKWKKGTVRDEAGTHISSIQRDLQTTLPPLLKAADDAPATTSKILPVARNVGALYDVLLSVREAARVSAPPEQVTQLDDALSGLGNARRTLDDRIQESAATLEKQVVDLRTVIQTQASKPAPPPPAAAPVCTPPPPVHKPKKKIKPPTATQPATATPAPATPKTGP